MQVQLGLGQSVDEAGEVAQAMCLQTSCLPGPAGRTVPADVDRLAARSRVPTSVTVTKQWLTPALLLGRQQASRILTGFPATIACWL